MKTWITKSFLLSAVILSALGLRIAFASSDAIAIRILPNPMHYSPARWYAEQKFKGSPQAMIVDGYEAVRDGNTVYVNAANISGVELYTNIYAISFNKEAEQATSDIFGQILEHWKFNTNLNRDGSCSNAPTLADDCTGTVGCWPLKDNFNDYSPNQYTGSAVGPISFQTINKKTGATFPAGNDKSNPSYISVGEKANLRLASEFTISADVYPVAGNSPILNKEGEYEIQIFPDGSLRWALSVVSINRTAVWQWIDTGYKVPLNAWTSILWSYGKNNVRVYANGVMVQSYKFNGSNNIGDWSGTMNDFNIGYRQSGGIAIFNGKIANVRIYDKQLNGACSGSSDCGDQGFCESTKSSITRDIRRLADLTEMNTWLRNYRAANGNRCPVIAQGSYIPNHSVSTWPSWQSKLGTDLGQVLPLDPLNKLGLCRPDNSTENAKFDPITCWDFQRKIFATSTPPAPPYNMNLPDNSWAYRYTTDREGKNCAFQITTETGLTCDSSGKCTIGNTGVLQTDEGLTNPSNELPPADQDNVNISCGVFKIRSDQFLNSSLSISAKAGTIVDSSVKAVFNGGDASIGNNNLSITKNTAIANTWTLKTGKRGSGGSYKIAVTAKTSLGATKTVDCNLVIAGKCGDAAISSPEKCEIPDSGNQWGLGVAAWPQQSSVNKQYECQNLNDATPCSWKGGYCGDNAIQANHSEECEANYVVPTPRESSATRTYRCAQAFQPNACTFLTKEKAADGNIDGYCGDGKIQPGSGEECDDSNRTDTDACNNDCKWTKKVIPNIPPPSRVQEQATADAVVYDMNSNTGSTNNTATGTYIKLAGAQPTPYAYLASTFNAHIIKLRVTDDFGYPRTCMTSQSGVRLCQWDFSKPGAETVGMKVADFDVSTLGSLPSRTAVNVETGDFWVHFRGQQTVARFSYDGTLKQGPCNIQKDWSSSGTSGGGITIDKDGNVWAGNFHTGKVTEFKPIDGLPAGNCDAARLAEINTGYNIYGLVMNGDGNIFFRSQVMGRINTADKTVDTLGISNGSPTKTTVVSSYSGRSGSPTDGCSSYGVTIDFDGNPWWGCYDGIPDANGGIYALPKTAPSGTQAQKYSSSYGVTAVSVDVYGNLWGSGFDGDGMVKFDTVTHRPVYSIHPRSQMHGISGSSDGRVFALGAWSGDIYFVNPDGTSGGTVNIPGMSFYTYADMAGLNRAMALRSGNWTKNFDSGFVDQHWGQLSLQQIIPNSKTSVEVYVSADNDQNNLTNKLMPMDTWNAKNFTDDARKGRYAIVRILLRSGDRNATPVVYNINLQ